MTCATERNQPRKSQARISARVTCLLMSALLLAGCAKQVNMPRTTAILAEGVPSDTSISTSSIGNEQLAGYGSAITAEAEELAPVYLDERMADSDLQRQLRDLVEQPNQPMAALLGGTSNGASSHLAALVNFFSVPMVIPSAYGENIFPTGNLWAFRLSPPSSAYANYLFGSVITKQAIDAIQADLTDPVNSAPELAIAILYEGNTFGEAAAVATAKAAMAQEVKISLYQRFDPTIQDSTTLRDMVIAAQDAKAHLVYIIVSDPAYARNLVNMFTQVYDKDSIPLIVGQEGAFTTRQFQTSAEAKFVTVLGQAIDPNTCPDTVRSAYDAKSYAAVALVSQAYKNADAALAKKNLIVGTFRWKQPTIAEQREALRDAIKVATPILPCIGQVKFDTTGQNTVINLQLVQTGQNGSVTINPNEFIDRVSEAIFQGMMR